MNWRKMATAAAISASGVLAAAPAIAGCKFAAFDCSAKKSRDVDAGGDYHDLKSLHDAGRSDSWIAAHCRVLPHSLEPSGCNWRGGSSSGGGGGTIVISDAAPAKPSAPKRDAWGKRSPTPAPAQPSPAPASAPLPTADAGIYAQEIAAAAQRYKLPPQLVRAVMTVESGGNPLAVSNAGAIGLMQLLPGTAQALGVEDIRDPAQNIMGGARFLRVLANKFDGDMVKVLSGYHAGSMRVLSRDATPFAATDDYVRKVLRVYYQLRDAALRGAGSDG